MENYDYEAAAGTVKIEDITSDECNREILRKLKANDAEFDDLVVVSSRDDDVNNAYCSHDARSLGWVGHYIGKSTKLHGLRLRLDWWDIVEFFRGGNSNRSIQKIHFHNTDLWGGDVFQWLGPFFENNNNLSELKVYGCNFGVGSARQLSLAIQVCSKSLKSIKLEHNQMGDEQLTDVFEAMAMHPQLEELFLPGMNIGRNECIALANLVRSTTTRLEDLNLDSNAIDDEGVDALMDALTGSSLLCLGLSLNHNITVTGLQSLAALLEHPNSNLEMLFLYDNNIGDAGARIFANALATNCKLKILYLSNNGISAGGWPCFSKVLCDTSSINKTFLSNHTLEILGVPPNILPADVRALLTLNEWSDKKQVAIKKILKHHRHFVMQPFFEWDLKVLPIAIAWFDRARSIEDADEEGIGKCKLSTIYQFVRAMPEVFEPAPAAGDKRKPSAVGN